MTSIRFYDAANAFLSDIEQNIVFRTTKNRLIGLKELQNMSVNTHIVLIQMRRLIIRLIQFYTVAKVCVSVHWAVWFSL